MNERSQLTAGFIAAELRDHDQATPVWVSMRVGVHEFKFPVHGFGKGPDGVTITATAQDEQVEKMYRAVHQYE